MLSHIWWCIYILYIFVYVCHSVSPFVMLICFIYLMFLISYKLGKITKLNWNSLNYCFDRDNVQICEFNLSDVWQKSLLHALFVFHQLSNRLCEKAASCLESMLCGVLVREVGELAAVIWVKKSGKWRWTPSNQSINQSINKSML